MNLNQLLKKFRIKNGMTQEQLADKVHVSHQTISKWEKGINTPSIDNLLILSDLYNISLDELIRGGNYLKRPFVVGKKVSSFRVTVISLCWLAVCLFFLNFDSISIWILILIFIAGVVFLVPSIMDEFWILEKRGFSIQYFPNSYFKKYKAIMNILFNLNNSAVFISFENVEKFELIYKKRERYSPFDLNADYFFILLVTKTDKIYQLPISVEFKKYLPQACLLLEKKNISVVDRNDLINAILSEQNLFEYMNKENTKNWN